MASFMVRVLPLVGGMSIVVNVHGSRERRDLERYVDGSEGLLDLLVGCVEGVWVGTRGV